MKSNDADKEGLEPAITMQNKFVVLINEEEMTEGERAEIVVKSNDIMERVEEKDIEDNTVDVQDCGDQVKENGCADDKVKSQDEEQAMMKELVHIDSAEVEKVSSPSKWGDRVEDELEKGEVEERALYEEVIHSLLKENIDDNVIKDGEDPGHELSPNVENTDISKMLSPNKGREVEKEAVINEEDQGSNKKGNKKSAGIVTNKSQKEKWSVRTQKAFQRIQMLHRHHKFFLVALMKPFQHVRHLQFYRRRLRMSQAGANCNGKIWFFVANNIEVEVLSDSEQHISLKLLFQDTGKTLVTTLVYAKCSEVERLQLWDNIYNLANGMSLPWMIGGDFNVVLNEKEKIGGIPVFAQDIEDFAFCINSCELDEIQFKGSPFTWWNGRASNDCIFERLDRMLFWVEHESFLDTVQQNLLTWMHEDPFISFKLKSKHMKWVLSQWSRATYGDIFKQLIIREEIVRIKENLFEECPSSGNRSVLQQSQADSNSTYTMRRNIGDKSQRIQDLDGNWLDNEEEIANEVVKFYHKLFTQEEMGHTNEDILQHIPCLLDQESNEMLCKVPSNEEVKAAMFNLSGSSASGPDGFSGLFYQVCWPIVEADVIRIVLAFFQGVTLPKSITHTNVVLIPEKEMVQSYSDLRPISLSNFINKVLSRVLHDRLEKVLPALISPHQSGFVKGRSIIENVLLTQEIVTDIRKRGKPANVVLKLDMAKACDRISWSFLTKVLNQMGFSEGFIDKIWRLITNNCLYVGYGLPKWSANINHLAYADDTIIFAFAERNSLKMIMDILRDYEAIFDQLISIEKSAFYM
ncbi:uncharacterized protein LOC132619771 [Lycium barbarum]|uniref:uncharacterized protein LOC132619771 n=1 Tax=Lycium barbarum TaxID=112863 RepID=UPI00293EC862|nr:uncharacterized protein LOC132619771 [Lycium barbarum]